MLPIGVGAVDEVLDLDRYLRGRDWKIIPGHRAAPQLFSSAGPDEPAHPDGTTGFAATLGG